MKRLITPALLALWTLALAIPATAVALDSGLETKCSASALGCEPTHTTETFHVDANGNRVWTTMECNYSGLEEEATPEGGARVFCTYGDCGRVEI